MSDAAMIVAMARRNRVDPFGDLHAATGRGLFTGNRGCLVDDGGQIVRRHQVRRWITCLTEFRGWWHPLEAPHRWTPVFFLDDAVALAAGHRPCALCRRDAYRAYGAAVAAAGHAARPPSADELDLRLHEERLATGRGLATGHGRSLWRGVVDDLPDGTVVVEGGRSLLVLPDGLRPFTFDGWGPPRHRPANGVTAAVLTPATSVAALRHGFQPVLHPSATCNRSGPGGVSSP
jgi:hypothetical protein